MPAVQQEPQRRMVSAPKLEINISDAEELTDGEACLSLVRNTFIDVGSTTLEERFKEIRLVRSCPGSEVGRLERIFRESDEYASTETPSTPESKGDSTSVSVPFLQDERSPAKRDHAACQMGSEQVQRRTPLSSAATPFSPGSSATVCSNDNGWGHAYYADVRCMPQQGMRLLCVPGHVPQGVPVLCKALPEEYAQASFSVQAAPCRTPLGNANASAGATGGEDNCKSDSASRRRMEVQNCQKTVAAADQAAVPRENRPPHSVPVPPPAPCTACASPAGQVPAMVPLGSEALPSIGSAGHVTRDCKPCAFLHTKGCESGKLCLFCHLCDAGEKKRRQKEKKFNYSKGRVRQ
eukprot:gb/GFBE01031885.1/.p1 GENE.gb/GFBE01031885.1/~~gb/GFBE01031885.1/.p1  ORF type:complete len:351 (+),score=63.29 gb/GFBE01031885.1/:1-1053(+)